MRLLLDAHVSGRRIGKRLRKLGHDVRAVDEEPALEGCDDDDLLSLAAMERRILVTFDAADFPRVTREWSVSGKRHSGCLVVVRLLHHEFGAVGRAIEAVLAEHPDPANWEDRVEYVARRD